MIFSWSYRSLSTFVRIKPKSLNLWSKRWLQRRSNWRNMLILLGLFRLFHGWKSLWSQRKISNGAIQLETIAMPMQLHFDVMELSHDFLLTRDDKPKFTFCKCYFEWTRLFRSTSHWQLSIKAEQSVWLKCVNYLARLLFQFLHYFFSAFLYNKLMHLTIYIFLFLNPKIA